MSGLAIALCCHHRCDWRHYVGKEFFRQRGLGSKEFAAFQRMSSWATCGIKKFSSKMSEQLSDHKTQEEEEHEIDEDTIPDSLKGWVFYYFISEYYIKLQFICWSNGFCICSVMSVEEREQIGRLCKRLIDQGRVHYLQQRGFESSLKYYTSRDVSLENVLLTAVPSSNQNTAESKLYTNSAWHKHGTNMFCFLFDQSVWKRLQEQ